VLELSFPNRTAAPAWPMTGVVRPERSLPNGHPRPARIPRLPWWLLALALALPLIVWGSRRDRDAARVGEVRVPDGWAMADLLRKLEPLGLRVVPCNRNGVLEDGAYLTATGLAWEQLGLLQMSGGPGEEALARWRGTVHVQPCRWCAPLTWPLAGWRSALRAGRFYFYGDPDLLDRVESALAE
jgi:hypothetical protein